MRDKADVYVTNPGHGEGVTPDDLRALAARRTAVNTADLPNLGPVTPTANKPRRCGRCNARVFIYATTTDGERHYCGTCVRHMSEHGA